MKLKPVQTYTDVPLKGRVPGELHAALTAYTSYYHETTGQPIEVWALVVQMLDGLRKQRNTTSTDVVANTAPSEMIPAVQCIPNPENAVASGSAVSSSLYGSMPVSTNATAM